MSEHLFQGIVDEGQTRVPLGIRRILSSSSSPSFTAAPRNSGRSILTLTFQATGEPKRRRDVRRKTPAVGDPENREIGRTTLDRLKYKYHPCIHAAIQRRNELDLTRRI